MDERISGMVWTRPAQHAEHQKLLYARKNGSVVVRHFILPCQGNVTTVAQIAMKVQRKIQFVSRQLEGARPTSIVRDEGHSLNLIVQHTQRLKAKTGRILAGVRISGRVNWRDRNVGICNRKESFIEFAFEFQ